MDPTSAASFASLPPSSPTPRLARSDEIGELAAVLADAFDDDPVMRFIVPNDSRYRARLAGLFRLELKSMVRLGGTWVVDGHAGPAGVAIWAPPDQWKQSPRDMVRSVWPAWRVFGRAVRPALAVLGAVERAHPTTPAHWYLGTLGAVQSGQGRGVGGALLRAVLDQCDTQAVPAYLESSKPENVPYYERFGFEARGELPLPRGGPTIIPMWRDPRPPTGPA